MFDLYIITDAADPECVVPKVTTALSSAPPGRVCVQLRAKHWPARHLYEIGRTLLPVCRAHAAKLIVNDRIDVALSIGADGVHLPELGLSVPQTRRLLGSAACIGVSCHDQRGLERAAEHGADFATLSPVFVTPNKGEPLGLIGFAALARQARLPTYALGGIRPEHAAPLRAAGAAGLAVISAIWHAADASSATHDFLRAWNAAAPHAVR